jgi:hypothetical protein
VYGNSARLIPKIAAATELLLGNQLRIHVDDPPEPFEEPEPGQLQANLLALEYSMFGDLRSANDVWKAYDLPSFTATSDALQLPEQTADAFADDAMTTLGRKHKFGVKEIGLFEEQAAAAEGYALSHVSVEMSEAAKAARKTRDWAAALNRRSVRADAPESPPKLADEDKGNERRIEEAATTSTGLTVFASMHVWYEKPALGG